LDKPNSDAHHTSCKCPKVAAYLLSQEIHQTRELFEEMKLDRNREEDSEIESNDESNNRKHSNYTDSMNEKKSKKKGITWTQKEQCTHTRCELLCKKGSLINPNGKLKNHRLCSPCKFFQARKKLILDMEWELMGNNVQEKV